MESSHKNGCSRIGMRGGVHWTDLAQERDRRWTLVIAVTNLRVP
jgi:hypothetical protein